MTSKAQLIASLACMTTEQLETLVRLATRALRTRKELARRRR